MRECIKIKFSTELLAYKELKRIVKNNDYRSWIKKTPNRVYLCPFCKSYHLTSKIKIKEYGK